MQNERQSVVEKEVIIRRIQSNSYQLEAHTENILRIINVVSSEQLQSLLADLVTISSTLAQDTGSLERFSSGARVFGNRTDDEISIDGQN